MSKPNRSAAGRTRRHREPRHNAGVTLTAINPAQGLTWERRWRLLWTALGLANTHGFLAATGITIMGGQLR